MELIVWTSFFVGLSSSLSIFYFYSMEKSYLKSKTTNGK